MPYVSVKLAPLVSSNANCCQVGEMQARIATCLASQVRDTREDLSGLDAIALIANNFR